MIKMARDKRNVDVAAFADWFSVVDRFENGKTPRMFLNLPRQRVQIFRAFVRRESLPDRQSCTCSFYGCVNIGGTSLRDFGDFFQGRGIGRFKIFSFGGRMPFAADEVAEAALVGIEPD